MPVRPRRSSLLLPLLILFLAACEGDEGGDGTGPGDLTPLVGAWTATSWTVTNVANASQSVRLIESGARLALEIAPDGGTTVTVELLGSTQVTTGSARVEDGRLILDPDDPDEEDDRFDFTLSGDTLTLEGLIPFDFNGDGSDETAETRIVLVR